MLNFKPSSPIQVQALSYGLVFLILLAASFQIDFHPDEAIYLSHIPVNLEKDNGLVFHFSYYIASLCSSPPIAARLISLGFGMLMIYAVINSFNQFYPQYNKMITLFLPLFIIVSYQAIFLILRVRPEISWVALSAIAFFMLIKIEQNSSAIFKYGFLAIIFLLPMNHQLSWFACAYLLGYLIIFKKYYPIIFIIAAIFFFTAGVYLNIIIRANILNITTPPILEIFSGEHKAQFNFLFFAKNLALDSALSLNDYAEQVNFYNFILPSSISKNISHYLVQNTLWLSTMLILPFLGTTWKMRYALAFPLFAYISFFASNYYNATYSAIFSLYCTLCVVYLTIKHEGIKKYFCIFILFISFINGLSFLATRIFNHGQATFFGTEQTLTALVATFPQNTSIAYPERYTSIATNHSGKKYVIFKDPLPENLDYLILDDYDLTMYHFVDNFEGKVTHLKKMLSTMCPIKTISMPIYSHEKLDPAQSNYSDNAIYFKRKGSWFFRNSAAYSIKVMMRCEQ